MREVSVSHESEVDFTAGCIEEHDVSEEVHGGELITLGENASVRKGILTEGNAPCELPLVALCLVA